MRPSVAIVAIVLAVLAIVFAAISGALQNQPF